MQKNFTSSSLNKRALLHLFAQIFSFAHGENASSSTSPGSAFLGVGILSPPLLYASVVSEPIVEAGHFVEGCATVQ